jgi:hypothetical protein
VRFLVVRLVVRLVVVVAGLAAVVFADASLRVAVQPPSSVSPSGDPTPGWVAISVGVGAVGLAAVACAAWSRRRVFRVAFGALGLAVAVYGSAWLTGGWLGVPPWTIVIIGVSSQDVAPGTPSYVEYDPPLVDEGRRGESNQIAAGVVAVGLALITYAVWPRRSTPRPPTAA